MVKLLVFSILIVGIVIAFPLSLGFFNGGFSSLIGSITTYSGTFFSFFQSIFTTLFNAPTLSIFLGVGFAVLVIRIVFSIIGGDR